MSLISMAAARSLKTTRQALAEISQRLLSAAIVENTSNASGESRAEIDRTSGRGGRSGRKRFSGRPRTRTHTHPRDFSSRPAAIASTRIYARRCASSISAGKKQKNITKVGSIRLRLRALLADRTQNPGATARLCGFTAG